jgi:PIN domain nuclease of toxin-antitoxin system
MRLLLDTHIVSWYYLDDPKLSRVAKRAIENSLNQCFVSPVSHWEIAIKLSRGKWQLNEPFEDFIQHAIFDNGFTIMPIEAKHSLIVTSLPYHHNDPFDRMLIAQAISEGISIVSADAALDAYGVIRVW